MLQTETFHSIPQLTLFPTSDQQEACPPESNPLPPEFLDLFEQLTGWVVSFQETRDSYQQRQLPSMVPQIAVGNYEISDMSARWPAGTPTGHREKCDRVVSILNGLVADLQMAKTELAKTQSLLESYQPGAVTDGQAVLTDSFIPRHEELLIDNEDDFELVGVVAESDRAFGDDITVQDDHTVVDEYSKSVDPPFEGWQFKGSAGFIDGRYIDWRLDDDECIQLISGQIGTPTDPTESESTLKVDPLTKEYLLAGESAQDFLIFDQSSGQMQVVEPSNRYRQLKSCQMLVATTCRQISNLKETLGKLDTAESDCVAKCISENLGQDEKFLILHRTVSAKNETRLRVNSDVALQP